MNRFLLVLCLAFYTLSATANVARVETLLVKKEYKEAIEVLDKLIQQQPQQAQYQFLRARALADSGQTEAAVTAYQALIQHYPDLPEPYNNLAFLYAKQGNLEQAESLLNQAMQTNKTFDTVYNNLTALNAVKARKAYARALNIPVGSKALQMAVLPNISSAPPTTAKGQEGPKPGTQKTDPGPTLAYKAASSTADKKNDPVGAKDNAAAGGETEMAAKQFLQAWAKAWSAQDVDSYLGFYHAEYTPRRVSRADWVKQRHERIRNPKWIKITLSNFIVKPINNNEIRVQLDQLYKTNSYTDLTRKEFILKKEDGQLSIIKERGLGFIKR